MTEREYRQDDQHDVGYCPKCGKQLANLTTGLRGYCEQHGWTFADFTPVQTREAVCAPLCGASKAYGKYDHWWHHEALCPVRQARGE